MPRKSSNGNPAESGSSRIPLTIRLPQKIVRQIDQDLDGRDVPLSRNTWLLEAALEKLRKGGVGGTNGAQ
jgi:hypothetical protein